MSLTQTHPLQAKQAVDRRRLVAGSLAVAWLLFGSRWAAYVGIAPLFLTDVLIALALAHAVASTRAVAREPGMVGARPPHALLYVLLAWTTLRTVLSPEVGFDMLRDSAPYFYAVLGVLAAVGLRRSTPDGRAKTGRLLLWALGLHALWVGVVRVVAPGVPDLMPVVAPSQGLSLFETRTDFEPALVAVFSGWLAILMLQRRARNPFWCLIGFAGCWVTILTMGSRAALIGAALVMLMTAVAIAATPGRSRSRRLELILTIGVLAAIIIAVVPATKPGQRMLGSVGLSSNAEATQSAQGTANARLRAWRLLVDDCAESLECTTVGVGYGPNYLADSGALYSLTGLPEQDAAPRAPHDYWLNTQMRGGLVGLLLVGSLVFAFLVRARSLRRELSSDPLLYVAAAVPVGLLVPATFGVILESPFGAVPFWWCLGLLLAWPDRR